MHQGHTFQLALIILGIIGNLFLGAISIYASRLQQDVIEIEAIARTGAANAALLGRDVENLAKWTREEIQQIRERLRRMNDDQPYRTPRR